MEAVGCQRGRRSLSGVRKMAGWWEELRNLIYPVQCAGCGLWDHDLCDKCWQIAAGDPVLGVLDGADGLPQWEVWHLGNYGGKLRNIILAAKHQKYGRFEDFLYQAGTALGVAAGQSWDDAFPERSIWVVPAPPSWKRRWDRALVTLTLAQGVVEGLGALGIQAQLEDVARLRLGVRSQSAKGGRDRRRGRAGAIYVTEQPPPGTPVVLVDDVITTGATMTQLASCLEANVVTTAVLARA